MEFFIALFAGAIGGNLAHGLLARKGFGLAGNTILGTVGGGVLFILATNFIPSFREGVFASVNVSTLVLVLVIGVGGGIVLQLVLSLIFRKSN